MVPMDGRDASSPAPSGQPGSKAIKLPSGKDAEADARRLLVSISFTEDHLLCVCGEWKRGYQVISVKVERTCLI